MVKRIIFLMGIMILVSGCQKKDNIILPTLFVPPTESLAQSEPTPIPPTETIREVAAVQVETEVPPSPTEIVATETDLPASTFTQIPSDTPTFTLTSTPSQTFTATFTPTSSLTPSITPSPTLTLSPTSDVLTAKVTAQNLNIRNGPGDEFDVIAHLTQDAIVPVLGTDSAGDWILIEYEPGLRGWVASGFVEIQGEIAEAPNVEPTALPEYVFLDGMQYQRQTFNNCAPTATTIALTYFGSTTDPTPATSYLRPSGKDVSVDIGEMTNFVNETYPFLRAVWRMGGSWTTIRRLLAAGYPVVIETSIEVTSGAGAGWAGHNRVLVGYDGDVILTYDSYLGSGNFQGYRIFESVLDELWRHMNRNFMVIYPVEKEAEVAYLMGEDWLIPSNIDKAHRIALAEMAANPNNAFALFNLGATYVAQKNYKDAAGVYDQAFDVGIPFRIFWYQFGVFEAYYYMGRYNEIIDIARRTLYSMSGMGAEEVYYWLGMGYAGRGQIDQAIAEIQRAVDFNPRYKPAQDMLRILQAGQYVAPTPIP